jgi:hypothetical protein
VTTTAKKATAKLGTTWEIPATERVEITRPDGTTTKVEPVDGVAHHVLNQTGEYSAGDQTVSVK